MSNYSYIILHKRNMLFLLIQKESLSIYDKYFIFNLIKCTNKCIQQWNFVDTIIKPHTLVNCKRCYQHILWAYGRDFITIKSGKDTWVFVWDYNTHLIYLLPYFLLLANNCWHNFFVNSLISNIYTLLIFNTNDFKV